MAKLLQVVAPSTRTEVASRPPVALESLIGLLDDLDRPAWLVDLTASKVVWTNPCCDQAFSVARGDTTLEALESGFVNRPSERLAARPVGRAGSYASGEGDFRHAPSQRWYRIQVRSSCAPDGHRMAAFLARDVTTSTQSRREQTAQHERLLMTSRMMSVGELVSTLAHELNQPLGAIANYLGGALRHLKNSDGQPRPAIVAALEMANRQAEHAARVVLRMREFVRTREPRREVIDLRDVIAQVLTLLELPAQENGVRIDLDLPPELPAAAGDRVMIEQVVLNLVKNAIEAMREVPSTRRVLRIAARTDLDGCLELSVEDRGPGISADAQEQLYSPFFTTKPDGMGMGLNICRSIMEYHQGRLFFINNEAGGSTFCITLPPAAGEAA